MKELQWGETPFDHLSQEDLLRQCQRLYSACSSLASVANVLRYGNEAHPYWGATGVGGKAIARGEQAIEIARAGHEDGDMHAAFFRYADDLLFEGLPTLGKWVVCDACGGMMKRLFPANIGVGEACVEATGRTAGCAGTMRLLEWRDLRVQSRTEVGKYE